MNKGGSMKTQIGRWLETKPSVAPPNHRVATVLHFPRDRYVGERRRGQVVALGLAFIVIAVTVACVVRW